MCHPLEPLIMGEVLPVREPGQHFAHDQREPSR